GVISTRRRWGVRSCGRFAAGLSAEPALQMVELARQLRGQLSRQPQMGRSHGRCAGVERGKQMTAAMPCCYWCAVPTLMLLVGALTLWLSRRRLAARSVIHQEAAQLLAAARMTQLAQRLGLYLPNPLARDVELLADFLEGVVGVHI